MLRRSVTGGEHQITAVPKLLAQLDLKGHTVTMDKIGTQVPTARQIVDAVAHYILSGADQNWTVFFRSKLE